MSWIHETDMNRLFERALTDSTMQGPYIASSPYPVAQRVFMRELRRTIGMPIGLPAFSWMVRLGARWLLRTDPDLALYGRYVVSKRLKDEQFEFQFPHLRDALQELIGKREFHLWRAGRVNAPVLASQQGLTPPLAGSLGHPGEAS
jgi:NAD dependent epimerase/dehydratase family enzyme